VIVTMAVVGVVQVPIDQVVDMITVRYGFVSTTGAVNVIRGMALAGRASRAFGRIVVVDRQHMLFHLTVSTRVMQVPVMQIIDMVGVLESGVTTSGAVLVLVIGVQFVLRHHGPFEAMRFFDLR